MLIASDSRIVNATMHQDIIIYYTNIAVLIYNYLIYDFNNNKINNNNSTKSPNGGYLCVYIQIRI